MSSFNYIGIGMIIGLFVCLPIFIHAFYSKRKRLRIQNVILEKHPTLVNKSICIPIRYCNANRFKKFWKIYPWQNTGILFINDRGPTFVTYLSPSEESLIEFHKGLSIVSWVGCKYWPNGPITWFVVNHLNEKYYFTSETGTTVFGSKRSTKDIFDSVNESMR